nr:MAG TPA: hypothetical protein [Caudoviricetes sp.]
MVVFLASGASEMQRITPGYVPMYIQSSKYHPLVVQ